MTIPATHHRDWYKCGSDQGAGTVSYPAQMKVKVVGLDAACYGDICRCIAGGHETLIAEGAAKVLIEGKPAARLSVKTVDGGCVLSGEPSVLIGGESFSLPACITIGGDLAFQARVLADLYKIGTTKSGQRLFADMQASGKRCTIVPGPGPHTDSGSVTYSDPMLEKPRNMRYPIGTDRDGKPIYPQSYDDPRAADGTGTDAKIYYGPGNNDSTLFHEGMHANDTMHGITDEHPVPNPGAQAVHRDLDPIGAFERKATGLSPHQDHPYSQNTYNKERGYPLYWYKGFAGNVPPEPKKKP